MLENKGNSLCCECTCCRDSKLLFQSISIGIFQLNFSCQGLPTIADTPPAPHRDAVAAAAAAVDLVPADPLAVPGDGAADAVDDAAAAVDVLR